MERSFEAIDGLKNVLARERSLRELILARVLYRCGDSDGLGYEILTEYTEDLRGHFARHADAILREGQSAAREWTQSTAKPRARSLNGDGSSESRAARRPEGYERQSTQNANPQEFTQAKEAFFLDGNERTGNHRQGIEALAGVGSADDDQ